MTEISVKMTANSATLIFKWQTFLRFPRHNFLAPRLFYFFPEAWVSLYLKYPRSTTQGTNIKEGSMDSRAGMARRMMWLIRTKCFSFEKMITFILRRYIRLWWLMSIVFKMLLQWHHHHVFHHSGTSRCATKPSLRLALPQFQGSLVVLRFGSHFMQVVTSLVIQHY